MIFPVVDKSTKYSNDQNPSVVEERKYENQRPVAMMNTKKEYLSLQLVFDFHVFFLQQHMDFDHLNILRSYLQQKKSHFSCCRKQNTSNEQSLKYC